MAHKKNKTNKKNHHGITLWPWKIKKCDPKRLEVTRHARHDKAFTWCYFSTNTIQKKKKSESLSVNWDAGLSLCLCCPALPHHARSCFDLQTGSDRKHPQPEPPLPGCQWTRISNCVTSSVCGCMGLIHEPSVVNQEHSMWVCDRNDTQARDQITE